MAINRGYTANHKIWDRGGRLTPIVESSHSERPSIETAPASWLPVQREEKEYEYYVVVSSGKVVSLDTDGYLVPAGLRKAWNKSSVTTILTYTTTDYAQNVIDLTTGVAVAAGGASYTEDQVTQALKEQGKIRATERAMDFISKPVGFASYNYYKAAGTDWYNPANLFQHNFRPQANTAITCDYCMKVPLVPSVATTETMANDRTGGAAGLLEDYLDGTQTRAAGWFTSTQIAQVVKFSSEVSAGDNVVCYMTLYHPMAWNTDDTAIVASVAGLTNAVSSISAINSAGDYYFDYEMGLLFLYEAGGNAIPSPWSTAATLTYYHYQTALASAGNTYMCATGNLKYGDFLTYDESSNLVKATLDIGTAEGYDASFSLYSADPDYGAGEDDAISLQLEKAVQNWFEGIVGQVIGVELHPRSSLERVKTAFSGYTAANMRTPGSATGGRSDQLTYASAGETMLIVNFLR